MVDEEDPTFRTPARPSKRQKNEPCTPTARFLTNDFTPEIIELTRPEVSRTIYVSSHGMHGMREGLWQVQYDDFWSLFSLFGLIHRLKIVSGASAFGEDVQYAFVSYYSVKACHTAVECLHKKHSLCGQLLKVTNAFKNKKKASNTSATLSSSAHDGTPAPSILNALVQPDEDQGSEKALYNEECFRLLRHYLGVSGVSCEIVFLRKQAIQELAPIFQKGNTTKHRPAKISWECCAHLHFENSIVVEGNSLIDSSVFYEDKLTVQQWSTIERTKWFRKIAYSKALRDAFDKVKLVLRGDSASIVVMDGTYIDVPMEDDVTFTPLYGEINVVEFGDDDVVDPQYDEARSGNDYTHYQNGLSSIGDDLNHNTNDNNDNDNTNDNNNDNDTNDTNNDNTNTNTT